jgi:DNA polymerase-3 subunit epsilon
VAAFAATVPAVTALVVVAGLDAQQRQATADTLRSQWVVLALGLAVLVGGVWWIMRGGLHAHDQAALRLAASARTAATVNLGHRARPDETSDGLRHASDAVNALAERAERAEQEVASKVAAARGEVAVERDRLAAVLAELDHPVIVCTQDGLVLLLNDAARVACGAEGYLGVGRSVFSVLDRDDLADPVRRALGGERLTAQVRCGSRVVPLRVGPVTEAGRAAGFVLVGAPQARAPQERVRLEDAASTHLESAPRPSPRPVVYDFRLLELDAAAAGADDDLRTLAFTVLDLETTGLNPLGGDKVVSVGAVRVDRGRVREDDVLDRLVDPRRAIPATATAVHGITDAMVAGRSRLPEVLTDLSHFAADSVLVGHDIAFDLAFLRPVAQRHGIELPHRVLDTLLISAVLHPAAGESHALDVVAERLGVPVLGRHTALGDALVTAEILVRIIEQLAATGITTYGQALAAASSTRLARESAKRF